MAANTVLIRVDTVEKEVWDAILALAGESEGISVIVENADTIGDLVDASESILALADKANELLALLDDGGDDTPSDGEP